MEMPSQLNTFLNKMSIKTILLIASLCLILSILTLLIFDKGLKEYSERSAKNQIRAFTELQHVNFESLILEFDKLSRAKHSKNNYLPTSLDNKVAFLASYNSKRMVSSYKASKYSNNFDLYIKTNPKLVSRLEYQAKNTIKSKLKNVAHVTDLEADYGTPILLLNYTNANKNIIAFVWKSALLPKGSGYSHDISSYLYSGQSLIEVSKSQRSSSINSNKISEISENKSSFFTLESSSDSSKYLGSITPISQLSGYSNIIVFDRHVELAFRSSLKNKAIFLWLIAIFAVTPFILLGYLNFSKDIENATTKIKRMSKGDLKPPTYISHSIETKELSNSIARLAKKFRLALVKQKKSLTQKYYADLQETIRDNFSEIEKFKHPFIENFGYEVNGKDSDGHLFNMKQLNKEFALKYIGNITIKGSTQALIISAMHAIIKSHLDEDINNSNVETKVSTTIKKLHLYLRSFSNSGIGCLFFIAVSNLKTGKVWYINASMPKPIIFKSGDSMEQQPQNYIPDVLNDCIPPLGFESSTAFKVSSISLDANECLFAYSHNLPELKIYGNARIARKGIILHCLNAIVNNSSLSEHWNKLIIASKKNDHMPESVAFIFQKLESQWKAETSLTEQQDEAL